MGVRDAAVLDAGDCVIERLRDGADAAAAHGAHVVSLNGDAHRRKPVWIVASDGRGNDIEGGVGDAVHAELRVGANDEGAQVKRRARLAGDPICLRANKGIHGLDEILRIEHGKAHPLAGGGKPFAVVDDAKQADVPVRAAIGLQTLENLSAVMKDATGRMQGDLLQGLDACVVPPEARRIFHRKHSIREDPPEADPGERGGTHGGERSTASCNFHEDPTFLCFDVAKSTHKNTCCQASALHFG